MRATTHPQLQTLREPLGAAPFQRWKPISELWRCEWEWTFPQLLPQSMTDSMRESLTHTALRRHQLFFADAAFSIPPTPPHAAPLLSLSVTATSPFPLLSIMVMWLCWYSPGREVKGSHTRAERRRKEVVRIARVERKACIENQYPAITFHTGWGRHHHHHHPRHHPHVPSVYTQPKYSAMKMGLDWILKAFIVDWKGQTQKK